MIELSDLEFSKFQNFIFQEAGITLSDSKKALVSGRLEKRLRHHKLGSYAEYFSLLSNRRDAIEVQMAVDLLTTNETYFFREPKHFDFLRKVAQDAPRDSSQPWRVWSAACSSGEEVYSIAMVLADCMGTQSWEVLGSDISTRVLARARHGHYPMERTVHTPPDYLRRFCLRGIGVEEGTMLVQRSLRQRVQFAQVNLDKALPNVGMFDVIFLRNVMIYFSNETKRRVVARLIAQLRPGGYFLISHSETLNDVTSQLQVVMPSVYRKP